MIVAAISIEILSDSALTGWEIQCQPKGTGKTPRARAKDNTSAVPWVWRPRQRQIVTISTKLFHPAWICSFNLLGPFLIVPSITVVSIYPYPLSTCPEVVTLHLLTPTASRSHRFGACRCDPMSGCYICIFLSSTSPNQPHLPHAIPTRDHHLGPSGIMGFPHCCSPKY